MYLVILCSSYRWHNNGSLHQRLQATRCLLPASTPLTLTLTRLEVGTLDLPPTSSAMAPQSYRLGPSFSTLHARYHMEAQEWYSSFWIWVCRIVWAVEDAVAGYPNRSSSHCSLQEVHASDSHRDRSRRQRRWYARLEHHRQFRVKSRIYYEVWNAVL